MWPRRLTLKLREPMNLARGGGLPAVLSLPAAAWKEEFSLRLKLELPLRS